MTSKRVSGTTPLDRLTVRFEKADLQCPECRYEDEGGRWKAKTDGRRVLYRHVCPRCGAIRTRTYRMSGE